jgi:carboxypeptidase C (cathepsin A)
MPNAETWLDFADLVFIDPAGTGFSRLADSPEAITRYVESSHPRRRREGGRREPRPPSTREDGGPGWFWSVHGDIESLGEVIATWLRSNARLSSPAIIVGESYGGFRGPRLAAILRARHQILVRGLVLVSPVLDFVTRSYRPEYYAALLPSLAAVDLELRAEAPTRQALREAEAYAAKGFLPDLEQFSRDGAAAARLAATVARLTGLRPEVVRRHGGKLAGRAYMDELNALGHDMASLYDASLKGFGPKPATRDRRRSDPFMDQLAEPLTSAMFEIYDKRLGWRGEGTYELLSRAANWSWNWTIGSSRLESMTSLETALASNPHLHVLVVHGFTDLVTPYFASLGPLARVQKHRMSGRVGFTVYPGGHMFYDRDRSRAMFKRDAARFAASLQAIDD